MGPDHEEKEGWGSGCSPKPPRVVARWNLWPRAARSAGFFASGGLMKNGPAAPALASASRRPHREGTSLFPAKREAKREATKAWQAWPGNQTSSRCLVRSLVSAAGGYSGPGFEIRAPFETKWYPTRKSSGAILLFLEVLGPRS